jgi:ParB family chromosome partitioning protein
MDKPVIKPPTSKKSGLGGAGLSMLKPASDSAVSESLLITKATGATGDGSTANASGGAGAQARGAAGSAGTGSAGTGATDSGTVGSAGSGSVADGTKSVADGTKSVADGSAAGTNLVADGSAAGTNLVADGTKPATTNTVPPTNSGASRMKLPAAPVANANGIGNLVPTPDRHFAEVRMDEIAPNPNQPRKQFNSVELNNLAAQIDQHGLVEPILLTNRVGERNGKKTKYIIVAGERRFRAHEIINKLRIQAVIRENMTDKEILAISIIENIGRADLNPIELANSYNQLINEHNMTHDQVGAEVKKSRVQITNALRLLKLPEKVQQLIIEKKLSTGQAKVVLGLKNPENYTIVVDAILDEHLSVRDTEELVKDINRGKTSIDSKEAKDKAGKLKTDIAKNINHNEDYQDFQDALEHYLTASVNVQHSNGKGKIVIKYGDFNDFKRIVRLIKSKDK